VNTDRVSTRPPRKPNTTYSAPIGSVDLAATMDDGTPYLIWPCQFCLPRHAEAILDEDSGQLFVREWHAVDCEEFQAVLQAAQGAEPEDQPPA
jgi:hypothetical protein